jgi:hypothetical protein
MNKYTTISAGAAMLAAAAVAVPVATAASAKTVTVKVVGLHSKVLLKSTAVAIPSGKLSFDGHKYAGNTVLGVLESATKGKVKGSWSSYGAFVYEIEGQNLGASGKADYYETLINGKSADLGDSSQTVKAGQTVMIEAVKG